ncbi:MAG: glycosyltransferase family 4 protein [Bacteroidales bacterium]|nr:glycosyltransferase family 4 protein [Bacteroidales bacterium]
MKKVLIITYYWPPSGGAGVQRWLKFTKYLHEFGWEPIVLTVDENKASYGLRDKTLEEEIPNDIRIIKTKTFELYSLYKFISGKKEIPHSGFANESKPDIFQKLFRAIRGNLFIPDPRKGWNKFAFKAAGKIIKKENIQIVITTSPPHSTQILGLRLKKKFNVSWIADIRDPWTDIYFYKEMYRMAFARNRDKYFEKKVLRNADKIIVVGDFLKKMFIKKDQIKNTEKIFVLPNGFDLDDFQASSTISQNEFIITYTGTISDNYDINAFINAFGLFLKNKPEHKIKIRFVGQISDNLIQVFKNKNLEKFIEIVNYVEHSESVEYVRESTLLLLAIPKIEGNEGIITGKIFEYLASKKPIIGIGPINGDAAKIISDCNAGKMFDYKTQKEIVEQLNNYYHDWEKGLNINSTNDNFKKFSRRNLTQKLIQIIEN